MKWPLLLFASTIPFLMACGRTNTAPRDVIVSPLYATVPLGKTFQFTNTGCGGTPTWSVLTEPGRGIISATGLYHAPFFLPSSPTTTIEARVVRGLRVPRSSYSIGRPPVRIARASRGTPSTSTSRSFPR